MKPQISTTYRGIPARALLLRSTFASVQSDIKSDIKLTMSTVLSQHEWSGLEKRSQQEQKEFLDGWEDGFRNETVSSVKRNVKKGDHLVSEGAKYDHHFLCSGVTEEENDDIVEIIEYTGSTGSRNCSSGSARAVCSLDSTGVGGIKKKKYTYEELEAKKVSTLKVKKKKQLCYNDVMMTYLARCECLTHKRSLSPDISRQCLSTMHPHIHEGVSLSFTIKTDFP
jgi:hypothetical protein